ncbi:putative nuclease HARBI1 isoform X2 [Bactrocera neohumeralis]|uniref:putative nuclease HARBI1 isoform X2 n=1 Tax=Bactrocera neohumeralis TaxID=98809 RepID=UPI002166AA17|nr:putative nuclease HARBI1 isoform X2 [Bactrocera neohumeralis]
MSWHYFRKCQSINEQNKENQNNLFVKTVLNNLKMNSVALWDHYYSQERIDKRIIRDNSDIMSLSDKSFMQNFRLNKHAFLYVLDNIRPQLKVAQRTTSIPEIVKLSTTLKFLAQGGYQHSVGQDRHSGLAQQSVSRCILEVCDAIEKTLCPKHIVFPLTIEEKIEANRTFYLTSGIPGVIGVIDGTHIQLIRPSRNEHLFFNHM